MPDVLRGEDAEEMLARMGEQVGMWRFEPATGRILWSDRLLQILGLTREEFRPELDFLLDRVHPEDRETMAADLDAHARGVAPMVTQIRVRHASGDWRVLRSAVSAARTDGPAPVVFGVVADVTDAVAASTELAETRRSLDAFAASVPGALLRYIRDADGVEAMEYMSPGCIEIWEVDAAAFTADPGVLWRMVPQEDRRPLIDAIEASARTLAPFRHRWRIRTPSGREKWLAGRAAPRRMPGGGTLWHGIVLDISDEVRLREELVHQRELLAQAQKLEAIGRIAGGIAHDFNNLLAIVMGNAELLGAGDDVECREEILRACRRGSDLTRRLLSFARQSRLEPKRIDLSETVRVMQAAISRALPQNVRLDIALAEGLAPVEADLAFLESAVFNLVLNARDAMPDGGALVIETAAIDITEAYLDRTGETIPPGPYVMLAVTDTGHGMEPEMLTRAVEPFVTTKGPSLGSGLGLAMVDGFVRQSGGALRLYSERGSGTAVKLFLPASGAAGAAPRPEAEASDPGQGPTTLAGRVLLVEDEDSVRRIAARILRETGLDVAEAASGDEALTMFETAGGAFDLVLTDVVMPGELDGPALADAVRARRPDLPVVFMSGYPNEAALQGSRLDREDTFLMKPVQRRALLETVGARLGVGGT